MSKSELNLLKGIQEDINESKSTKNTKLNPEMNSSNEETSLLNAQELNTVFNSEKSEGKMEKDKSTATYFHVEIF